MEETNTTKVKRKRVIPAQLNKYFHEEEDQLEIGVDEAGRGPLFGRVYTGAVILPKDNSFKHEDMKDSKKFTSEKKIREMAEYIKKNAIAWSVTWEDEKSIDKINILNATHKSMHNSIKQILKEEDIHTKLIKEDYKCKLLIDGNNFKPLIMMRDDNLEQIPHVCIKGGDNKYTAIAAASILAKVTRDEYIAELCKQNPKLDECYNLGKNKGYGTKKHIEGIHKYGISEWHRKSYGICKDYI
jgi:ribonuclease HII